MSFGFLAAGFLATTNAGRVALASTVERPRPRTVAAALLLGFGVVAAAVLFAADLLDGLAINPESFRIAAGMVLAATGLRTIIWPQPVPGPFAAILVTPELVLVALSFGADESTARALSAAAVSIPVVALAALKPVRWPATRAAQFLAALQLVVAVALVVSGVRDV
jgi:hypothetical protein